jgi:hypothetical protein
MSSLASRWLITTTLALMAPFAQAEQLDVAPLGTASQTSEWAGGLYPAALAIDGNPLTFSHTDASTPGNSWTLTLDHDYEIGRLEIAMRADCCGGRLTGSTVRLFDGEGDSVYNRQLTDPGPGQVVSFDVPAGLIARSLRIGFEDGRTNPSATTTLLHFGEIRVFAEIEILPVITTFEASPTAIATGETITLAWQAEGADTVELTGIGPVATTGSVSVSPRASQIYSLVASNSKGSRTRALGVTVDSVLLPPRVTEFMAANARTLVRSDGTTPDWIEIWNPNPVPINLGGYRLTDNADAPSRFVFPSTSLPAGAYLIVDADPLPRDGILATGFKLNNAADQYLAFHDPAGQVLQTFTYPRQREDVSYGPDGNGEPKYFLYPTPGEASAAGTVDGFVEDTRFSLQRGFYDQPQTVGITSATPGAIIFTTIDGSEPTPSNPKATAYSAPLAISTTTTLRAAAFRDGYLPTNVDTQTYLFANDVADQSSTPPNFPLAWVPNLVGVVSPVPAFSHFGMDDRVVASLPLTDRDGQSFDLRAALLAIPTMSLVMNADELFDPATGIHVNAQQRGRIWERRASIEYIDPTSGETHQANCGIRTHGGWNRFPEMLKKSFRLYFRSEYGDAKLDFPLFPDSDADSYDRIILRSGNGKAWPSPWRALSGGGNSLERNTYLRDQFVRDLQAEMGSDHVAGNFVHLYVNGHYWGLYNPVERPDEHFASSHFGGFDEDYDVIKWIRGVGHSTAAGSDAGWNTLVSLARSGPANPATYAAMSELLDLPAFIDYMLLNYYAGNSDWVDNNTYALRDRTRNGPFKFYCWDAEETFLSTGTDSTGQQVTDTSTELHHALRNNPEYRILFADRAQKHLFNGGALTQARTDAIFLRHARKVDRAIVGDSARWGNLLRPSNPYDRTDWFTEVENIRDNYLGSRVATVLGQLRNTALYPTVGVPRFTPQRGGVIAPGFVLSLTPPTGQAGTLYYTTDGSDPRLPGGAVSPMALAFNAVPREEILVPVASEWRYLDNGSDLGSSEIVVGHPVYGSAHWNHPAFADAAWASGGAPLGYGSISGATIQTPVGFGDPLMRHTTTYFRRTFTVSEIWRFSNLRLRILRDDGAVVYLNGREIARSGFPAAVGIITADTFAIDVSGGAEGTFQEFAISPTLLAEGLNILAVEVHQSSLTSSDLGFDLSLAGDALAPGTGGITIGGDTLVRTRALSGNVWSALDEALFLVGNRSDDLHLSEIMYHPASPLSPDAEFIEIVNRGAERHSLVDLLLRGGIQFDFSTGPAATLAPGARLVLVRSATAFSAAYPGVAFAGVYSGALGNGGDTIILQQTDGTVLWSITYDDREPWPGGTDGDGYSLTYVAGDQNAPSSWRPSAVPTGSPGKGDAVPFAGGDILNYAIVSSSVGSAADGTVEFRMTTRLGADDAQVIPEWSDDLAAWNNANFQRLRVTPTGNGTAEEVWSLPPPSTSPHYFRARVLSR